MKLLKQSYEILDSLNEDYSMENVYKFIEKCARTCYKSENKITNASALSFVKGLIKSGHLSMLEHGTIYYRVPLCNSVMSSFFVHNPYSKVNIVQDTDEDRAYYITTNLRVLIENKIDYERTNRFFFSKPTKYHYKRRTVKLITARQIANEFVRHRAFSFAQESTRYCNYADNSKFENNLVFISPVFMKEKTTLSCSKYYDYLRKCENLYLELKDNGWNTEEVATLLPNVTKTELIMTGFGEDWQHFFELRADGMTGKPHPMAKEIAGMLQKEMLDKNLI